MPYGHVTKFYLAQSAGAVEYTNCISAEGWDSPNKCPRYDTKQSDGEASVMPLLLPSVPGPLLLRVVAPDRALSMGQLKLNSVLNVKLNCLK